LEALTFLLPEGFYSKANCNGCRSYCRKKSR